MYAVRAARTRMSKFVPCAITFPHEAKHHLMQGNIVCVHFHMHLYFRALTYACLQTLQREECISAFASACVCIRLRTCAVHV